MSDPQNRHRRGTVAASAWLLTVLALQPRASAWCGAGPYSYGYGDDDDDGPDCTNLDDGATDPFGDGCDAYAQVPGWCGLYDSDVFSSEEMCCGCGGGLGPTATPTSASPTLTPAPFPSPTAAPTAECRPSCYGYSCDFWFAYNSTYTCAYLETAFFCSCDSCYACGGADADGCTNSDDGATDNYGDGCYDYAENLGWCGNYNNDVFTSDEMCCACGGGVAPTAFPTSGAPTISSLPTPFPTYPPSVAPSTDGATSTPTTEPMGSCAADCYGQTCDFWGESCEELESVYYCSCTSCEGATPVPTPWEPCSDSCVGYSCDFWTMYGYTCDSLVASGCNCDGCETCSDGDDGGGDSFGYGYAYDDDDGPDCTNLDDGATDPDGDGCDDYAQVPGWCVNYDSDVFSSEEMCCACGGGGAYSYSYVYEYDNGDGDYPGCTSSDDGAADPFGDGCGDYAANQDWCGKYDSEEFTSDDMCCACPNGGSCAPSAVPTTAAVPTTPSPSPEGATPPPTACFEDCLGVVAASGCRAALQGSCFGNCNEAAFTAGTWAYSYFVDDCCFATYDDDDGFNPFEYFPCPAQAVVSTSIGMSGLDCADYGTAEEAIVKASVADNLDGVEADNIGDTTCDDDGSRRKLRSASATVSFDITVTTGTSDDGSLSELSASALASSVTDTLASVASSGELESSIVNNAATSGSSALVTIAVASVVTTVSVTRTTMPSATPTIAPTVAPTVIPTVAPTTVDDESDTLPPGSANDDRLVSASVSKIIVVILAVVVCCFGLTFVFVFVYVLKGPRASPPASSDPPEAIALTAVEMSSPATATETVAEATAVSGTTGNPNPKMVSI